MRIISNARLRKLIESARESGYGDGWRKGRRDGYDFGVIDGRQAYKEFSTTKEAPVLIESIQLKTGICQTFSGEIVDTLPIEYVIKFRLKKSGAASEISLSFDNQNFSMVDIRRRITEEFCGCGATDKTEEEYK